MPDTKPLRLIALDEEDLAILSAHLQDAVCRVGDMRWIPAERRFAIAFNRFAWEAGPERRGFRKIWQRRRTAVHFERVERVRSAGIDRRTPNQVLSLLAVSFEPRDAPAGDVLLVFSGGPTIRLTVECIEVQLSDLGAAWSTPHAPRHVLG